MSVVLKFGGASVASVDHFSRISDIVISRKKEFKKVIVVVSAMGNTTDELIALAKKVNPNPPRREYDMLVTVGERISISLLAMSLAAKNLTAVSFTGSQSGIITCNRHSDARIIDVKPFRLHHILDSGQVAIVAGFQGVSKDGQITTLGRGGSDTTAVALGIALQAEKVEFFKDVDGIYAEDPKLNQAAELHTELTYAEALEIARAGAKVLNARSIELAARNAIPLHVRSFYRDPSDRTGTIIRPVNEFQELNPTYELAYDS